MNPSYSGAFTSFDKYNENDTQLLIANKPLTSRFSLNGTFGGNRRYSDFNENTVAVNGISVPNIYNVSNAALAPMNDRPSPIRP